MGNPSLLFKGQMIQALRNAQPGVWPAVAIDEKRPYKWQTRRVMAKQPLEDTACPYGRAGDVAWVRETWTVRDYGVTNPGNIKSISVSYRASCDEAADSDWHLVEVDDEWYRKIRQNPRFDEWRPSIYMPRWASRDDLLIKWIRVERLRDISEADAKAEGVAAWTDMFGYTAYRAEFSLLWDGINGKPKKRKSNPYTGRKEQCYVSYPWADEQGIEKYRGLVHYVIGNPWLWAIAFMRMAATWKSPGG